MFLVVSFMNVHRQIVTYAIVGMLMIVLVGLPLLSIGAVIHGTMSSQWSVVHVLAWLHLTLLVVLACLIEPPKMWRR